MGRAAGFLFADGPDRDTRGNAIDAAGVRD